MTTRFDQVRRADAIVVGSGVAGLSAALALAPRQVLLVTKTELGGGSTPWAQGGIAAALGPDDGPEAHAGDTVAVGAGLNDPEAVAVLTADGPGRVLELAGLGASFDRARDGTLLLGREAGHGARRIVHANGDATGAEVSRALVAAVRAAPHITVLERWFATDLVVDGGRVMGVSGRSGEGGRSCVISPAVVLATGGSGRLYANTTNPIEVTGDGMAMAHRAGARLADLEFIQFHPTALATGRDPMSLLTEALRGEGAVLVDGDGRRFMPDLHPDAELAPRDVVARAIWSLLAEGRGVFLDGRAAVGERFPERFPTVFGLCRDDGLDPRVEPIPVAPAAHYTMGGVITGIDGATTLPGLWAVGEVARTGVHGANRLASNSLLEGLVYGHRAAGSIAASDLGAPGASALGSALDPGPDPDPQPDIEASLRDLMWEHVGVVRTGRGLAVAAEEIERLAGKLDPAPSELANLLLLAGLVAGSALARTESRGGHFRADHPDPDPSWRHSIEV